MSVMSVALPQAGAWVSQPYSIEFKEEQKLPKLKIVDFWLEDENCNKVNDVYATENYMLQVRVENEGVGTAQSFTTIVDIQGLPASQLSYNREYTTQTEIKRMHTIPVTIPIDAKRDLPTGKIFIRVRISGQNDFTDYKKFETYSNELPQLTIEDLCIKNNRNSESVQEDGTLACGETYQLNFNLKNESYSKARNLKVNVVFPEGIGCSASGNGAVWSSEKIKAIHGKDMEEFSISFLVPEDYTKDKVDVTVNVSSSAGTLDQKHLVHYIEKNPEIEDIDMDIPVFPQRDNRFAIVIGNQDYVYNSVVEYAKADAQSAANYCEMVLGVQPENIRHYDDLSRKAMFKLLETVCADFRNMPDNSEIIFYYAGHAACGADSTAYLLPVDVKPSEATRGYRLRDLYAKLSETGASLVTVFLDACYTGEGRNEDYLATTGGDRGTIVWAPVEEEVPGNTVVFSASQKEEAAYAYDEAGHGFFTYCLLSELKHNPKQTYNELYNKVKERVIKLSSKLLEKKEKKQTPSIQVSDTKQKDWNNKYLKFN